MRVLACGCRDWTDIELIWNMFQHLGEGQHTLIHGGAQGADSLAATLATHLDWQIERYPADWARYGKRAGPIRNQQMLDTGKPEHICAFWDGESRGTQDMIQRAVLAGVPVTITPRRK